MQCEGSVQEQPQWSSIQETAAVDWRAGGSVQCDGNVQEAAAVKQHAGLRHLQREGSMQAVAADVRRQRTGGSCGEKAACRRQLL